MEMGSQNIFILHQNESDLFLPVSDSFAKSNHFGICDRDRYLNLVQTECLVRDDLIIKKSKESKLYGWSLRRIMELYCV
jgi:hypothetical protein